MPGFTTSTFIRHLRNAAIFISTLLGFGLQDAMACSCSAPTFAKTYELSANVFTAVITGERLEQADDNTTVARSTFTITETFKGAQPFDAVVSYPGGPCGVWLEAGAEYLFFTPDSGQIGVCSAPRKTAEAEPQIAALKSFVSGERSDLAEPWHFQSSEDGCAVVTFFESADDDLGALTIRGNRARSPDTPAFDSAEIEVMVQADGSPNQLNVFVDGATYQATRDGQTVLGTYVVRGEGAVEILRKSTNSDALYLGSDNGSDLDIKVSTTNLAQAGTAAKLLECMSSPAFSTAPAKNLEPSARESNADVLKLSTYSPYVPGLDQLVVGDRLADVKTVFPNAVFDGMEAGWVVRVDHSAFRAILYSSRRWPTTFDDDGGTIRRVVYLFKDDEDVDAVAARARVDALEKWLPYQLETTRNGYRTVWRNFNGQIVIFDRQRLLICMEFDWPPQR